MPRSPWTEQHKALLRELRARGARIAQCAVALGKSDDAVVSFLGKHGRDYPLKREAITPETPIVLPPPAAPSPPKDPVQAERERQEELRTLRERKALLKEVAGEESLRATVEKVLREVAPRLPAAPPYKPRAQKGPIAASRETMVQVLSDWHNGEVVYAESTRGHNAFNASVFEARVERVLEAHLSIKERLEAGGAWAYDECIVAANGDMVSGTIHELEKHSDHENVVWAVYETGMRLAGFLRALAGVYPKVTVVCTSGNHGRLPDARRVQQKEPTRSWDTVVYLFAKTALEQQRNVEFLIPNSYSAAFQVYDWRFLQTHGHDVKSWNSIPFYGINRLVGNINALEAGRGTPIHYWLLSHFHTLSSMPHATGEMFVNGSLIGGTEFTINALGKSDRPQQLMLSVHPEHGVTSRWPLYG